MPAVPSSLANLNHPLAIAMWDFSWLERRWPGGGYEDWDLALDELADRGYDAVRIDAYPHLLAADANHVWQLKPPWVFLDWGSPVPVRVRVQPELSTFISKCAERSIKVALSTWYQQDTSNRRELIASPRRQAEQWIAAVDSIAQAGLLDSIIWVDLCNEWPMKIWAPFFEPQLPESERDYGSEASKRWMAEAVAEFAARFPQLACTFSSAGQLRLDDPLGMHLLEPHIWMATANDEEYYKRLNVTSVGDTHREYDSFLKIAESGRELYEDNRAYWDARLEAFIQQAAERSRDLALPLATTEGWALVCFRDWPGLEWDWIMDLCADAVHKAISTERWFAICTSNFCGPQYRGMWRDVDWHRELTAAIKASRLPAEFQATLASG